VLASPSDVKREREEFAKIVDLVNHDTARPAGLHLDLWQWEADSGPGFHPHGPQGLIDEVLRIEECDLFVGIFWNRIGTPIRFGKIRKTGTEHEFETAYKSWKRNRSPEIMFYFSEKPSKLSKGDLAQRKRVLRFKENFPQHGFAWPYKGHAEFVKYANNHLRKFVRDYIARTKGVAAKKSRAELETGEVFILRIGRKGALTLPPALMGLMEMREGDHLQLSVFRNRIVSGFAVQEDQPFGPATVNRVSKRLSRTAISLTPSEFAHAYREKRNG